METDQDKKHVQLSGSDFMPCTCTTHLHVPAGLMNCGTPVDFTARITKDTETEGQVVIVSSVNSVVTVTINGNAVRENFNRLTTSHERFFCCDLWEKLFYYVTEL